MRVTSPLTLSLLAGSLSHALPAPQDAPDATTPSNGTSLPDIVPSTDATVAFDQLEQLSEFAQAQVNASLNESSKTKRGTCNLFNVAVRREWGTLSNTERKAYTDAVVCLQKKQAKTPSELIPGAKSRYDDWVGTHVNQTQTIHYTVRFLSNSRTFIFTKLFRVLSWDGTVTSHGSTSRRSETSVATRATSHTGTGPRPLFLALRTQPCLMAPSSPCQETVNSSPEVVRSSLVETVSQRSLFRPAQAVVASSPVPLPT
jgi:hypothetical protein